MEWVLWVKRVFCSALNETAPFVWNDMILFSVQGRNLWIQKRFQQLQVFVGVCCRGFIFGRNLVASHQNDVGNRYSPTIIAAAVTSKINKAKLPTHIEIGSKEAGLKSDSVVLVEQIRTIDKSRLKEKIGHIDDVELMNKVNGAIGISFGL